MGQNSSAESTIVSSYLDRIAASPDRPAIHIKREGKFVSLAWAELHGDVARLAAGLNRVGVKPGDRVLHVSENRYEWVVADLAIQLAGAIHVPVHASLTGKQIAEQWSHCGASVVLFSTADQARKLATIGRPSMVGAAENFEHVLLCYEMCEVSIHDVVVRPIADVTADIAMSDADSFCRDMAASITPDSLATILYTSGTTGEPKGVMLSQRNLASNSLGTLEAFGEQADDVRLNFLPLSHIFARTCDLYTWIARGSQLALAESRDTVLADCAMVKPTLLNGVPYFYDKVHRYLCGQHRDKEPESLRELLGGNIRLCCSGGAALPVHLFDFFFEQQVPLLQGYGLTESSPVITLSSETVVRRGSVGKAIPDVEVRLSDEGEILTRGPHVMVGYYRNDAATRQMIDEDGWLHTGDIGRIDDDGFLFITGRSREILVTSGGKNIAPVYLESLLTEDSLIAQAMVVGDGRNYLAALIVPNPDYLRAEIIRRAIPVTSRDEALEHPGVLALFEERIRERLRGVSHYEQVRRFKLLSRGFTIESGELTPKMSLRRPIIAANYASEIEALYSDDDSTC